MIDETFRGKLLNADKSCQGFDLEMKYVIKKMSQMHTATKQLMQVGFLCSLKFRDHTLETL